MSKIEINIQATVFNSGTSVMKNNQVLQFAYADRSPKTISLFFKDGVIESNGTEIVISKDEIEKVLQFLKDLSVGK